MAHDVFICHSSQDKLVANAACAKLEVSGVRCWIAPRDPLPGKPYGEQIVQAIAHSRIVLLVFSEHANRSRAVLGELELASNREKIILPFRIEDVVPSDGLEFYIRSVHWLDAMTPPIESRLADLVALVQRILETLPPQPGAEGSEVHATGGVEAPAEVRHLKVTWGAVGSKIVPGSAISYSYAKLPGQEDDEQVELVDAVGGATPVEVYERTSTSEIALGKVDVPKEARPGSKWRLRVTTWDESGQPIVALTTAFTVASPAHDAVVTPPIVSAASTTTVAPVTSSSAEVAPAAGAFAASPPLGAAPPVSPSAPSSPAGSPPVGPSFVSTPAGSAPKSAGSPISEPAARKAIEESGAPPPPPPPKRFAAIAAGIGAAALLAIVLLVNALRPHPQAVAVVSPAPASPSHAPLARATLHPKVAAKKIAPVPHKNPTPAAAHSPAPTPAAKPTPAATPRPAPTHAPTHRPVPKPTAKAVVLAPAQPRIPARGGGSAPDGYVVMYDSVPGVYWHAVECNQNGSDARVGFRLFNGYSESLYYETGLTNHAGSMPYDAWIPTRYVLDPGGTSITFYRTLSNWTCGVGTVYAALRHVRFGQDSGPYVPL